MRPFVSEHRFRLALTLCAVALVLMLGAIYATTGFNLTWNVPAGPGR